jgi:hypothetical protein
LSGYDVPDYCFVSNEQDLINFENNFPAVIENLIYLWSLKAKDEKKNVLTKIADIVK